MIHKVNRYDIHGRKIFESNDKFYFEDHGIQGDKIISEKSVHDTQVPSHIPSHKNSPGIYRCPGNLTRRRTNNATY